MSHRLVDLPPEILLTVLSFLPLPSLPSVFSISTEFLQLASSETLWQSVSETHFVAFVDAFERVSAGVIEEDSIPPKNATSRERVQVYASQAREFVYKNYGDSTWDLFIGKFVFLGDSTVGKTSLLERHILHEFREYCEHGIGAAFMTSEFEPFELGPEFPYRIQAEFWDTAGQERYRSLAPMYYRGSSGFFCVFDLTNHDSFTHVRRWLESALSWALRVEVGWSVLRCVVIGNKLDLCPNLRQVQREEVEEMIGEVVRTTGAESSEIRYFETSAKTNENVEEAFRWVITEAAGEWRKMGMVLGESGTLGKVLNEELPFVLAPPRPRRRCCH